MSMIETTGAPGLAAEAHPYYQTPTRKRRSRAAQATPLPLPTTKPKDPKMAKTKTNSGNKMPRRMSQQMNDKPSGPATPALAEVSKANMGMSPDDGIIGKTRATGSPCMTTYPGFSKQNKTIGSHDHIPKAAGTRTGSR